MDRLYQEWPVGTPGFVLVRQVEWPSGLLNRPAASTG